MLVWTCLVGLALASVPQAAALPADANSRDRIVRSLLEMRHEKVVIQDWDLSCGAAALATILRYQFQDEVTEKKIAMELMRRPEYLKRPSLVRAQQGFSLADLARYVEGRGYQAMGLGKLTLLDLIERAPAIVPVNFLGYSHFVVFRGTFGNRVLLADPAYGNRTLRRAAFLDAWIDHPEFGRVGLTITRPASPEAVNHLAPSPSDFVSLR